MNARSGFFVLLWLALPIVLFGGCRQSKTESTEKRSEAANQHESKPQLERLSLDGQRVKLEYIMTSIGSGGHAVIVGLGRMGAGSSPGAGDLDLMVFQLPPLRLQTLPAPGSLEGGLMVQRGERWGERLWATRMMHGEQQVLRLSPHEGPVEYRLERVNEASWAPAPGDTVVAVRRVAESKRALDVLRADPSGKDEVVSRVRLPGGMEVLGLSAVGSEVWLLAVGKAASGRVLRWRNLEKDAEWSPEHRLGFAPSEPRRCTAESAWFLLAGNKGYVLGRIDRGEEPTIVKSSDTQRGQIIECRGKVAVIVVDDTILRCIGKKCDQLPPGLPGPVDFADIGPNGHLWVTYRASDRTMLAATDRSGRQWTTRQPLPKHWLPGSANLVVVNTETAVWAVWASPSTQTDSVALEAIELALPHPAPSHDRTK